MKSVLKTIGLVVVLALVATVAGIWLSDCGGGTDEDDREAAEAVARAAAAESENERLRDALDAAYAGATRMSREDSARQAELEQRISADVADADSAVQAAMRSADNLEATLKSIRGIVRPSVKPLADTALAQKDSMHTRYERSLAETEQFAARRDSQRRSALTARDTVLSALNSCRRGYDQCEATIARKNAAIEKLQDANRTTFWERVGSGLPEILAKGGALTAACAIPHDAQLATCAGAGAMVAVDVAVN